MTGDTPERFRLQADQYRYPYHWLPFSEADGWRMGRFLWWGHEYLAVLSAAIDRITKEHPAHLLDFGCGDGRLSSEVIDRGVQHVTGIDLVEGAILQARAFNHRHGIKASFLAGDIADLDSNIFDMAVAMETMEHIPDGSIPVVVHHLHRVLKSGSRLLVTVPTQNVPLHPKHERHYTIGLLDAQLSSHFSLEDVDYVHRRSRIERVVRRLFVNKLFMITQPALLRMVTRLYLGHVAVADEQDGSHIVASFVAREDV